MQNTKKNILISVWDKNLGVAQFAYAMHQLGWNIISSGGTKKFLNNVNGTRMEVIDTADLTGIKPVLDHRVATLCPELHGGLLAEEKHMSELAILGWPKIDAVAVTFYPLAETMKQVNATSEEINASVDIGGPTLIRSACKGGRIVLVDEKDFIPTYERIKSGGPDQRYINWLHAVAAATVTQYCATESLFRTRHQL